MTLVANRFGRGTFLGTRDVFPWYFRRAPPALIALGRFWDRWMWGGTGRGTCFPGTGLRVICTWGRFVLAVAAILVIG
jgi:hypothetical protein